MSEHVPNGWQPCPQGEFTRLVETVRLRKRRRRFVKAAAATGFVLAGGAALTMIPDDTPKRGPSALSCRVVIASMNDYANGRLDDELAKQIDRHLGKCPPCHKRYREQGLL